MENFIKDNIINIDEYVFTKRAEPVPYSYRLSYKLGMICLILYLCSRGGCSVVKLHLIAMGISSDKGVENLKKLAECEAERYTLIRFDPTITRIVSYAIADLIIYQQANGYLKLTKTGKEFVDLIIKDKDLLQREKNILSEIGNKITEEKIRCIKESWGI
jgi:hypothetical protein